MTKTTRNEVDNFFELFSDIIDDVVVTQYQERGGIYKILRMNKKTRYNPQKNNSINQYIAKANGDLLVSM